jgi:hypothetical protein
MNNDMVWILTKRNIELEKRVENLEKFIEELKWNIEYKWGLDRPANTDVWDAIRHLASR